jgi:EKC/KEOPS complex subunit CGI121/TPRKB
MAGVQVETICLPHLPTHLVHVALFKNVSNSSFLRQQLVDANPDFEYAFLDATAVRTPHLKPPSPVPVLLALHAHTHTHPHTAMSHVNMAFSISASRQGKIMITPQDAL